MEKIKEFIKKIPAWVSPALSAVCWYLGFCAVTDMVSAEPYASAMGNAEAPELTVGFCSALALWTLCHVVGCICATFKAVSESKKNRKYAHIQGKK